MSHRIGIFSGTFDPVHAGHIAFAKQAMEQAHLDKVYFLVEPRPRRKQGVKAFEHRNAMLELELKLHDNLNMIILEHARFTVEHTLPVLKNRFKNCELYFLMGDDFLSHLASWPNVGDLMRDVRIIFALRKNSVKDVAHKVDILSQTKGVEVTYQIIEAGIPEVSSSTIKAALRLGKEPIGLSSKVYQYIVQEGLYTATDGSVS